MRRKRLLLQIVVLLIAGVVVVLLLPRRSPPPAPEALATSQKTTAAPIEAPVMITASAMRISGAVDPIAGEIDPDGAESGVLDTEAAAAVQAALDAQVADGSAEVLARPRIMVLSGQPARIVIGSVPVPGASPPTRQSVEVDVRASAFADGAADLETTVLRKDVSGELSVFLDDLGVPLGEQRAEGDLHLPPGSRAYLIRPLRDGSVLLVLLEVQVQLPEPGDGAEGG
jgi:hypothetical protein